MNQRPKTSSTGAGSGPRWEATGAAGELVVRGSLSVSSTRQISTLCQSPYLNCPVSGSAAVETYLLPFSVAS